MAGDLDTLRDGSLHLLERARDASVADLASAVDKATAAFRFIEEQKSRQASDDKLALEVEKLRHDVQTANEADKSARYKDYATLLTPLVAILGIALTSVIQALQTGTQISAARQQQEVAKKDSDKKEHDAMDAQWYAFAASLSRLTRRSPEVANIRKFIEQSEYRDRAGALAAGILSDTRDPAIFEDVFKGAFSPVNAANLPAVVRVDRGLYAQASPLWGKSWDPAIQNNRYDTKLSRPEQDTVHYVDDVLPILSGAVGSYLKSRPPGEAVDLSNTTFSTADWSGVDFSGLDLHYGNFTRMNFKGASLKGIQSFEGFALYSTAWWQARDIQPDFRDYLLEKSPCNPKQSYGELATQHFTQAECDVAMKEQQNLLMGK